MFVVCGEALYDLFVESADPRALSLGGRPGGSPFNVAVGLGRLEQAVAFFSGVSVDALGDDLVSVLSDEGVDTGLLVRKAGPTTLSLVALDEHGSPRYQFYGEGAADRSLLPADLPQLPHTARVLHFGSYSLVAGSTASAFAALARREHERCLISLDPNIRTTVEPDLDRWREGVTAMAGCAGVIKVSAEDLHTLYPDRRADSIVADWLALGAGLVVLTRGADGCTGFTHAAAIDVPTQAVTVIDAVGAGDAFQAALLDGLVRAGVDSADALGRLAPDRLVEVLARCNRAAALTCTRRGAGGPLLAELDAVPI